MKKLRQVLTGVGLSLLMLGSSLGLGLEKVQAQESLSVWAWDPNFNIQAFQVAEATYQEDHPDFHLEIIENAQDDIVQKLNTSLSSGVTQGLPNLVLIEDYRAQTFLESFPDSFFPLTDYLDAENFADYKIEATSYDGEAYAIPFDTGVTGLYVRRDLLEEAGYTLDELTDLTWPELLPVAEALKEKTGTQLFSVDLNDLGYIRAMIQSSGQWYTHEDGVTPNLEDNQALKEAFAFIREGLDSGYLNVHNDWAQMLQAFNTGQVAMVPQGNWITPSITAQEDQSGDWAVLPWPRQEVQGSVPASNLGGSSIYVLNIDGKEEAAEFIQATFGSNEDFYRELLDQIGALGTYLPLLETDAYDQEVPYFGDQPIYKDFAEWSQEIPSINYGSYTYAIEDILKQAMQDYLQGGDLETILEEAQKTAENNLS